MLFRVVEVTLAYGGDIRCRLALVLPARSGQAQSSAGHCERLWPFEY
jgi:hypothetical protein